MRFSRVFSLQELSPEIGEALCELLDEYADMNTPMNRLSFES